MGSKIPAHPFAGLLGIQAGGLPASRGITMVVAGKRIERAADIAEVQREWVDPDDPDDVAAAAAHERKLRKKLDSVRERVRCVNPERAAQKRERRRARTDEQRAKDREYMRAYRERNKQQWQAYQRDYAKRLYHADPEAARRKQAEYYQRHRERILQRQRERRAAARAAEQASKAEVK